MHANNEEPKPTKRELVIACLICQEKSSKQIAAELKIAISTVESHKKSLRKKTGSQTIIGVVVYCCKNYRHLLMYLLSVLQPDLSEMISL
jgi:DNA-binding CsgD family transcriptional regulator